MLVFVFGSVCLVCQLALVRQFVFACGLCFAGCFVNIVVASCSYTVGLDFPF